MHRITKKTLCVSFGLVLAVSIPFGLLPAQAIKVYPTDDMPDYPKRIVSINPCADALLMQFTDPAQIASISHYSHYPRGTSIPIKLALRFPATSGTAEEILSMKPDLVVAGSSVSHTTTKALQRLSIPLVRLSIPQSVAQSREQIKKLSEIVGSPERGQALLSKIDAAFENARPTDSEKIPALIWRSGGLVPGADTLADELLIHAGFQNMSTSYGLKKWDILPLEHLVARPPRLLFSNADETGNHDRMLSHPVLKGLKTRITIADYPARLLHCAGPALIDAITTLAEARRALKGKR